MDLNVNKQQSDIINYRPNLKMDNVPSLNSTFNNVGEIQKTVTITPPAYNKSLGLSTFEEYMPSKIVNSMENLLTMAHDYKANLSSQMAKTTIGAKYINAKDDEAKMAIAIENENSPGGTSYLEAYLQIKRIEEELRGIQEVYTMATYGEQISASMAREIDIADIDRMQTLENEGEEQYVNYTSLYYETMISNIMNRYCFHMEDSALSDVGSLYEISKSMPINDDLSRLISQNFNKKRDLLEKDILKDEKTAYNIRVALKNAFLAIQDYEDSLDAINTSLKDLDNDVLALELQNDLIGNLSESMEDLLSITTYSILAKNDIARSLSEKSSVREYFVE